jgi:hypothetical protein
MSGVAGITDDACRQAVQRRSNMHQHACYEDACIAPLRGQVSLCVTALVLCVTLTVIRSRSLTSLLLVGRFSARSMLV